MTNLILKQYSLFTDYRIFISSFTFILDGKVRFRFYFKDLDTGYISNPPEGKESFLHYATFEEGLADQIRRVEEYIHA